jgi:hypothetical protein
MNTERHRVWRGPLIIAALTGASFLLFLIAPKPFSPVVRLVFGGLVLVMCVAGAYFFVDAVKAVQRELRQARKR